MPTTTHPDFGRWLEAAMYTRQISQAQLARELGTHDAQVSRWRRGVVVPRLEHLERLSALFGVPRPTLERLAGRSSNTAAVSNADGSPSDPELEALVDQDRAELHDELHDTPRPFWQPILEARRAVSQRMLSAMRQAQALSAGGDVSAPPRAVVSTAPPRVRGGRQRAQNGQAKGISH